MSEKTIFKKIIDKEIPAHIVHENNDFMAFLDIMPVTYGHVLLIPKDEYVWVQELPDELMGKLFIEAKKIIIGMKQSLGCDYVKIGVVGTDIPHVHVHLIPRFFNDGIHEYSGRQKYKDGEIEAYAEKISSALK